MAADFLPVKLKSDGPVADSIVWRTHRPGFRGAGLIMSIFARVRDFVRDRAARRVRIALP